MRIIGVPALARPSRNCRVHCSVVWQVSRPLRRC